MFFPESLLRRNEDIPQLQTFLARDGADLAYRIYPGAPGDKVIVCLHGSGSHGQYLHTVAKHLSKEVGDVVVPNLRGHFGSGEPRGDCAYIGQLEDDLIDLMHHLHVEGKKVYLVGHSSGGGLAIRLAGGAYQDRFSGYVLLAPAIPTASTMKKTAAWAKPATLKIIALSILNGLGIQKFNHSPVITFDMPLPFRDGTETLFYTFNLNASYHPRIPYDKDIKALKEHYLCIVGEEDELMEPAEYKNILEGSHVQKIPKEKHLTIIENQDVLEMISTWIKNNP